MSIFHCLFYIRDNMISSLLYEMDGIKIMRIFGKEKHKYSDSFWKTWKEYAGMCSGDKTDFCLVYDQKIKVDEDLVLSQCDSKDCIWSRRKIEDAFMLLDVKEPTEIITEEGNNFGKAGCFMNVDKEDIKTMKIWYKNSEKETALSDKLDEGVTKFTKHYQEDLEKYKKGYSK